jgi:hypothetical protein
MSENLQQRIDGAAKKISSTRTRLRLQQIRDNREAIHKLTGDAHREGDA